ncbi:MAG: radical SAM family heme chaperone HemW [Gammaproteobacteria bacterium]|nr:radical SAM family heme chaperone HemW [Gammaproteobacteria bacterium]
MQRSRKISLYIHIPWCSTKCPYCDFNSYRGPKPLPETEYLTALIADLHQSMANNSNYIIQSIFIGGGTPTLLSSNFYSKLFTEIHKYKTTQNPEVTIEANPNNVTFNQLIELKSIGINRLSLGIQSLQDSKLKSLGRTHSKEQAINAFKNARKCGFDNINLDIMFGLPEQTIKEATSDLANCLQLNPEHISWYQLTIEPNTIFAKKTPNIPDEKTITLIEKHGKNLLKSNSYNQYEISAYSKKGLECQHNLNYWLFGNYIGIGAGAHSKLKDIRVIKEKNPKKYSTGVKQLSEYRLNKKDLLLEFMINTLRLYQPIQFSLLHERTGVNIEEITPKLECAKSNQLLDYNASHFATTKRGRTFLNDLLLIFS